MNLVCTYTLYHIQVQRIYEYHRLLVQLFTVTSKDHPDYDDLRLTVARVQHVSRHTHTHTHTHAHTHTHTHTHTHVCIHTPPLPCLSIFSENALLFATECIFCGIDEYHTVLGHFILFSHSCPLPCPSHPSPIILPLPLPSHPHPHLQMVQSRQHQVTQSENETKLDQVQSRFPNDTLYLSESLAAIDVCCCCVCCGCFHVRTYK